MNELETNVHSPTNTEKVETNESNVQVNEMVNNEKNNDEDMAFEKVERTDPLIVVAFRNIKYKFSYQPVMIYSFILAIVSLLGFLFFNKQSALFAADNEIVKACFIMIVFFLFFMILFTIVFVTSLVLNIMRVIKEKNEKE